MTELEFDRAEVSVESILNKPYFFALASIKNFDLKVNIVDQVHCGISAIINLITADSISINM
jgi:hypothetical protein